MTTTDLSQFGIREMEIAGELLTAYAQGKGTQLAKDFFGHNGVKVMFNTHSGNVFLTNDEFQVLMFNDDDELDLFLSTPYEGKEGFLSELMEEFDELHEEDKEYVSMFDAEIA